MPIRINLLAEAQAAEELRRKDPVKRAILMGAACVGAIGLVSLFLQSQIIAIKSTDKTYQAQIGQITNDYATVVQNSERLKKINLHMRGLDILAAERLLYGNLLNGLQRIYVDGVQMMHLRTDHGYELFEPPAGDKKDPKKPTKPPTSTERIVFYLEARDSSNNPGDKVSMFKDAVSQNAYFRSLLGENNELRLVNLTPPQVAQDIGKLSVQFTLEARPPEKTRLGISSSTRYAPTPSAKPAVRAASGPVRL
jgi:hypothetical protein